uniref:alpha-amylase n=1 Tax=Astyanax mexicanus TaxID=7994 RepID=A0A3B1IPC1_ASTMX
MKASVLKLCPFRLSRLSSGPNMKGWRTYPRPLFEWRWADIAAECERYLAPNGFEESLLQAEHCHQPRSPMVARIPANQLQNLCNNVGVKIFSSLHLQSRMGYGDGGAGTHSQLCTYFNANTKEFPSIPFHRLGLQRCQVQHWQKDYVLVVPITMNALIDMGVAGFRVDACKHMGLGELSAVYGRLNNSTPQWFSVVQTLHLPRGYDLGGEPIHSLWRQAGKPSMRKWNGESLHYPKPWSWRASIVTFWDALQDAVALMLAHPYGVTRVMSSFRWTVTIQRRMDHRSYGDGTNQAVPINADSTCGDGWVCEHRWRQISMVIFRNVVGGRCSPTGDNGSNFRCFRSGIHFRTLDATLATGLPGGTYCDVISGQKEGGSCTGKQVTVGSDGKAYFKISNSEEDPFFAIHADSKL